MIEATEVPSGYFEVNKIDQINITEDVKLRRVLKDSGISYYEIAIGKYSEPITKRVFQLALAKGYKLIKVKQYRYLDYNIYEEINPEI